MTPFQQLAFFARDGQKRMFRNPLGGGWEEGNLPSVLPLRENAALLFAWAYSPEASIPDTQQEDAICTHMVRVFVAPLLRIAPGGPEVLAKMQALPCAMDWGATYLEEAYFSIPCKPTTLPVLVTEELRRISDGCSRKSDSWVVDNLNAARRSQNLAYDAALALTYAANLRGDQSPERAASDAYMQAAAEWIALALPPIPDALRRLDIPGLLDFAREPAEPDAYAVAWDAMGGALPCGIGLHADGDAPTVVCHGVDRDGRPVPAWQRRVALARCLVRASMVGSVRRSIFGIDILCK